MPQDNSRFPRSAQELDELAEFTPRDVEQAIAWLQEHMAARYQSMIEAQPYTGGGDEQPEDE